MFQWFRKRRSEEQPAEITEQRIREKYLCFRDLLALNTECLEVIVNLQEDLQYIPPRRDVVEGRVNAIFEKAHGIVAALDRLSGLPQEELYRALERQRYEVERHIAALQELANPRLAAWIYEIGVGDSAEVGGKAAALGEVKNKVGLPVPNGYVITTEAYRQFCGIPHWKTIRDLLRDLDPNDLTAVRQVSNGISELILATRLPRAVEVAIADRARALEGLGHHLAVRSSAVGEGPEGASRSHAGQFLTLLNVPAADITEAYKRVIAGRFSERAIAYRLSSGLLEVDTPLAVLVLPTIQARAAGIMYTRDPGNPRNQDLWITATRGLGVDIAGGKAPADLFIISRKGRRLVERQIVRKQEEIALRPDGGLERRPLAADAAEAPSLDEKTLKTLADYGISLEEHFKTAQDVEWAIDENGEIWILQTRPLGLVQASRSIAKAKAKVEPLLQGGRTIFPGRVSGRAYVAANDDVIDQTPMGAILFLPRASAEIVRVFPRVSGLVAEWGNVAGHAAALLREFKIPSVFLMEGVLDKIQSGDTVSLDSVQAAVYPGAIWPWRQADSDDIFEQRPAPADPISRNILTLTLLDPAATNFRPSGCQSTHDVLRYCHERSVEAMFTVNDVALEKVRHKAKTLKTTAPLNVTVLDIGGGLKLDGPDTLDVYPEQVVSAPFQAFWRGAAHPDVSWKREMPAGLADLASIMAKSLTPEEYPRPLGLQSYLLVAEEYMNLNARVAYHFTLVDASLTDSPSKNYIAFRFVGGGATRYRRNLRACFVEECLRQCGFLVDRRGDLVNAWLKRAPAARTYEALDILGRLTACTSQLDMYMANTEVMKWFVRQFLAGNYKFERTVTVQEPTGGEPVSSSLTP
jgi:pyruvate,water dikinase